MADLGPPQSDPEKVLESMWRPPIPPTWVTVIWALSPVVIITATVVIFGRDWKWLGWTAFVAGVINMGVFSLWQLWSREIGGFELKAIPLTLGMIALNLVLLLIASLMLGIPIGPTSPSPGP